MTSAWTNGSTRRWRRIRLAVLQRDGWVCQLRLAGCTGRATCAHHVLGRSVTGDSMEHIVASCTSCNLKVGQPGRPRRRPVPRQQVYNRW